MKWKNLVILILISTVAVGCTKEVADSPIENQNTNTTNNPRAEAGTFKAIGYSIKGKVEVVTADSQQYLVFNENFKTDNGPDLLVILYRNDVPPKYRIKEKDYVQIAPLQKPSGKQRYAIPQNIKLADYKSVAIWCRKFNVTFGYATL